MAQVSQAQQSRRVAEQARQTDEQGQSFLREAFLGRMRPELLWPPADDARGGMPADAFHDFERSLTRFLHAEVDPADIDASGEYPPQVLSGLAELGAFGMKIGREYGGLGLSHAQYVRIMQRMGSYDANLTALLSAHQAIGVPHPVQMFGSESLKRRYLPRCARGAVSAFALTEPAVGSDPARLQTQVRRSEDGKNYILDGLKLWCTNGTIAEMIVVLARDVDTRRISCFVVEMDWPGVVVERRCHFMGLRALANAVISFDGVRVPAENLVGEEGAGLRIALTTLNTGRLTLPAATAGAAKAALELCRLWASGREQWGKPIGEHEAVTHALANMACNAYAMESLATVVGDLADRDDRDLRIEAAAAKEWNTVTGWELTDSALQIRGGRGYETEASLAARGEPGVSLERMLRDCRINRIFEGSSEIMHLFIAREAVDKHLTVAWDLVDPEANFGERLRALPRVIGFYALWYPRVWLAGLGTPFKYRGHALGRHLRYAERASRRVARALFHAMVRNGPRLEKKQALLFRAVDVGLQLLALVATITRAQREQADDKRAGALTEGFAVLSRIAIERSLHGMRHNDDPARYALGRAVLAGDHGWVERGILPLGYDAQELTPLSMQDFFRRREDAATGSDPLIGPAAVGHTNVHTERTG